MGRVKKGGEKVSPRKAKSPKATKTATRTARQADVEKPVMRVRELDPRAKCGAGTSVQRLFRVDAVSSSASETHLVFLDRHGLYCEHGRGCPAVTEVAKRDRTLKRITQAG